MLKYKKIVLGFLSIGFLSILAWGANPQVFKENSPVIKKYFGNQQPMGQGSVTKLLFTIYQLALWAENNKYDYTNRLAFHAWQEVEVTQQKLKEETLKKIYAYYHVSSEKLAKYESYLSKVYPAKIKPNETWTVVYNPNQSIDFYFNDNLYGRVEDMEFAKQYFEIWMNPNGDFQDLREKLLKNQVSPKNRIS
jgi:hypothetical protein